MQMLGSREAPAAPTSTRRQAGRHRAPGRARRRRPRPGEAGAEHRRHGRRHPLLGMQARRAAEAPGLNGRTRRPQSRRFLLRSGHRWRAALDEPGRGPAYLSSGTRILGMAGVFWRARPTRARCLPPLFVDASDLPPSGVYVSLLRPACSTAAGCARTLRRGGAGRLRQPRLRTGDAGRPPRPARPPVRRGRGAGPLCRAVGAAGAGAAADRRGALVQVQLRHPLGRRHFDVRLLLERDELAPHVTALLRDVTYTRGVVRARAAPMRWPRRCSPPTTSASRCSTANCG